MKDIITILRSVGLGEHEAEVYYALLSQGKLSISQIAKSSKIKRTSLYQYIENLLKENFIVRVPVDKRIFYAANSPKKILNSLKLKQKQFEENLEFLNQKYKISYSQPKVHVYNGKKEIDFVYNEVSRSSALVHSFFSPKAYFDVFGDDLGDFENNLKETDTKMKSLLNYDDGYAKRFLDLKKSMNAPKSMEKILPRSFNSTIDIVVYGDTVALISFENLTTVVIENPPIANFFRNMHKLIWEIV